MDRKPGQWPPVTAKYQPNDYVDDLDRGTVEYDPIWTNYSFHKVTIPAGTVIRDCNFAQTVPLTNAIIVRGERSVTFFNCNLGNVALNPLMQISDCNTVQSWVKEPVVNGDRVQTREFITDHPFWLHDVVPVPPPDAILTRSAPPPPPDPNPTFTIVSNGTFTVMDIGDGVEK